MKTRTFPPPAKRGMKGSGRKGKSDEQKLCESFPPLVEHLRASWDGETFVLVMPPNMGNARWHWRTKDALRTRYFGMMETLRTMRLVPMRLAAPPIVATMTAKLYVRRALDPDNAVARVKWALDWIVRAGYLTDDSPTHLRWPDMPEQIVGSRETLRIEIVLTPCKSEALNVSK